MARGVWDSLGGREVARRVVGRLRPGSGWVNMRARCDESDTPAAGGDDFHPHADLADRACAIDWGRRDGSRSHSRRPSQVGKSSHESAPPGRSAPKCPVVGRTCAPTSWVGGAVSRRDDGSQAAPATVLPQSRIPPTQPPGALLDGRRHDVLPREPHNQHQRLRTTHLPHTSVDRPQTPGPTPGMVLRSPNPPQPALCSP